MATTNYAVFDDLKLPLLEDSASIQVAISRVMNAFVSARIDARRTGLLLYAIQIASQNIDRDSDRENSEIVRTMTVTDEGNEMAPEKEVCEPADCASCNRHDTCEDYDPEEEDEELTKEAVNKTYAELPVARAVGAVFVSPALQRGVDEANNSSGVP